MGPDWRISCLEILSFFKGVKQASIICKFYFIFLKMIYTYIYVYVYGFAKKALHGVVQVLCTSLK